MPKREKATRHLIYDAIISLISDGKSDFTVSEIAERACIGKGTVYEYCSSKDELIKNAFVYYADNCISSVIASDVKGGFEKRIKNFISISEKMLSSNSPFFKFIILHSTLFFSDNSTNELHNILVHMRKCVIELIYSIIESGVEEGILEKIPSREQIIFAYTAVCATQASVFCCGDVKEHPILDCETQYKCFLKQIQ